MSKIMDCKTIAEKLEMSNNTIRTFLCRQEFNKYATYQRVNSTRSSICYFINRSFLDELLELMDQKRMLKQVGIIKRWKNEYRRIF